MNGLLTCDSTEAEMVGIKMAIKDIKYIFNLLEELNEERKVLIWSNSQRAGRMIRNGNMNGRTKHIDTYYKFIPQELEKMKAELRYLPREENIADSFTKEETKAEFNKFKKMMFFEQ
eukprot:maker-scaffold_41-snap-gene-2.30-mRNA-1 protein AED:0.42 eAED:0.44 QI:0/0/0/1/1/1/2/0/116